VRVLVVGGGGREHALVRALARSPQRPQLLCAPGNPGIGVDARLVDVAAQDSDGLLAAVAREAIDLTVVGPEAPLVDGLVDRLTAAGHRAFGPTMAAARLEGSKAYAKQAMAEAGVPTGAWREVGDLAGGRAAVAELAGAAGVVIKADGLAAGKGVTVAADAAEADRALGDIFARGRFGAGARALVEERLVGAELSLLALCDGHRALPMAPAQDYKRIFDGDRGPNTGGMGAYSPVPGSDAAWTTRMSAVVHQPVVDLMRVRGTPFHGILYAGLMLSEAGPRVLEYNVRLGDPETQAVLPRLRSDLLAVLLAATEPGGLRGMSLEWAPEWAVTVVLASAGYPGSVTCGEPISGLQEVSQRAEVSHAGTARSDGRLVTAGGRVVAVTGLGPDAAGARDAAYAAAEMIDFPGRQMRRDIALRAVQAEVPPAPEVEPVPVADPALEPVGDADPALAPQDLSEAQVREEVREEFAELDVDTPRVGVVMGSKSDMELMDKACQELRDRDILHEVRVMSAHREPDVVADYARNAKMRGLRVIIAGAGISAALPGAVAAHTDLPVIGVPLSGRLTAAGGLDAILSIVQMPPGVPVACVGLDNPRNAAILAAQILGSY